MSNFCFLLLVVIDIPRSALAHFLHYVPSISKGPALWSWSILYVLLLTRYSAPALTTRQWRSRSKNSGISPHMYTYPFFQSSCAVMSRCRFTHLTRSGDGTHGPDIFILVQLPFQPWNVNSTGRTDFESYTCIVLQACATYGTVRQCLGPWICAH